MRGVKKSNLPKKICSTSTLEFVLREKWEENWAEVKYWSKRCRAKKIQV